MSLDDAQARERIERLEALLGELDGPALDAVATLAEVYGEALRRVTEQMPAAARERVGRDEIVGHLLLVHDLHPLGPEARVSQALEELRANGADAELVAIDAGVARVRIADRTGCGPSPADVDAAVEAAILGAAPEIERVEIDGRTPPAVTGVALPLASPTGARA